MTMNHGDDEYEVALLAVRDFKGAQDIRIEPGARRNFILITGENGAGKSSAMDAFRVALGGTKWMPAKPVRDGADKSEITVRIIKLTGEHAGDYTVTRTIKGAGADVRTTLKIVGPDGGTIGSPQSWLDKIIADRFIDPSAFLLKEAKEQRKILLEAAGVDVDGLDVDRERAFKARTDENRALKAAETRRAGIQPMTAAPDAARPIDQIQAELDQVDAAARAGEDAARDAERLAAALTQHEQAQADHRRRLEELERQAEQLRAQIAAGDERTERGRAAVADARAKVPTVEVTSELAARRTALRAEQQRSSASAAWRAQKHERDRQIAAADAEVAARQAAADKLSAEIAAIDEMKAALLAGADMPIAGLEVTDDGILVTGARGPVPLEQASQAEQLRVAIAIAIRRQKLRDVMVRHGAFFSPEKGLATLAQVAEDLGCRVWVERPGEATRDRAVVIRDGRVAGGGEG